MSEKPIDKERLGRFVRGSYSRTDYKHVKEQFQLEEDADLHGEMQAHWESLPANQPLGAGLQVMLERFKSTPLKKKESTGRSIFKYYQRVAAVLFIPFLLAAALWMLHAPKIATDVMATIHSPAGSRTEFVLPDGSTGWLNGGSKLSYPVVFSENRDVVLEGEAYFEVVHQANQTFRVKTKALTVQVLGTSFNVAAYADETAVNVVLQQGKVQILDRNDQLTYTMKPDEKFELDLLGNKATVSQVDASVHTSWTKGLLRFDGEPLSEVVKKLARWYNVDFEIRDEQLQAYNFRATFKDEQLDEILRMISLTTPMKYRMEERKLNKDGTYMKKKIIIERR
ncbi:FecR domain-containing protein [uncultured Sunxiuqinia sp.]|uniref:FecR family protein n=1 Tax=uncultured Sunxiuqinia sp. TaxID=1573825 RepID=UPI002618BB5B|nr:FecR domain-containing protein [uncultured Sunxiuqinia sp.]